MKITLTGLTAELFQTSELETSSHSTVKEVKEELLRLKPELAEKAVMIAINKKLAKESDKIREEDQILVFHPYAGG